MKGKLLSLLFVSFMVVTTKGQTITTIAGTGIAGFGGDNGLAVSAQLNMFDPQICTDAVGNIYIADENNHRIRKIDITTGTITTIAGTGVSGFSGDGGLATSAQFANPVGVAVDNAGNIYICDYFNSRIRKINISGIITTITGTGVQSSTGDGGLATAATVNRPGNICVDPAGNIYFTELFGHRVRKIATTGTITTYAGTGASGSNSGNGGLATSALLNYPWAITNDAAGNVFVGSYDPNFNGSQVRKIATNGTITAYAGTGVTGYSGDGGLATAAQINSIGSICINNIGEMLISDRVNYRIRKVALSGTITTLAGNGTSGFSGDGGLSTSAQISIPWGIASYGCNTYFVDGTARIRRVVGGANPTITVNSGSICSGNTFTMVPSGANTYTFQGGSATVSPTTTTSYTIVGTSTAGCVSASPATSNLTVNAQPTIAVNSGSVCAGSSFTMVPSGASTYTFQGGNAVISPTANASYTVVGTSTAGCVSPVSATSNITVNALPTVSATSNSTLLCVGQTASLSASGANTYTWSTTSNNTVIAISPTTTTSYTLIGTDGNGCVNASLITQSVSACNGINQLTNSVSELNVYPNPFNNKLTIISNDTNQSILIYNALGSVIYSSTIQNTKTEINLSNQATGIYYIKIGTATKKIIKE